MRIPVEYRIISGRTTEVRKVMMDLSARYCGQKHRRGKKVKGRTTLRQMQANEINAVKALARILNCNWGTGDLWITLSYPEKMLPESLEAAKEDREKFLRKARKEFKKQTGKSLRYVVTTSREKSDGSGRARLHHHIVMDRMAYETIAKLWPAEDVTVRHMDGRGDYTGIARYMVTNAGEPDGKKRWSSSKGLKKPIFTEPVPCSFSTKVKVPKNVSLKERNEFQDLETGMVSVYVRYTKVVMRN